MRILVNGSPLTGWDLNDDELKSFSLSMSFFDGDIGQGSMTVRGYPWVLGDLIQVDDGTNIIYKAFAVGRTKRRHPKTPTLVQTTYTLSDLNRQFIGRALDQWARPTTDQTTTPEDDVSRLAGFIGGKMSDLTIDTTTWFDMSTPKTLLNKVYTGDGISDVGADCILASGFTYYMAFDPSDGGYVFHYHALTAGPTCDFRITDVRSDVDGSTVLWISDPEESATIQDAKTDVTVHSYKNGALITELATSGGIGGGGLKFQSVLQTDGDETALSRMATNIVITSGQETVTDQCVIRHLTMAQVTQLLGGALIDVTSDVLGLDRDVRRIAAITLSVWQDEEGQAKADFWDAALELNMPLRLPAIPTFGGDVGRLSSNPFLTDVTTEYLQDDPPVGAVAGFYGQLRDQYGQELHQSGVTVFFFLRQYSDESTTAGTGYSLVDDSAVTDDLGRATGSVSHDSAGTSIRWAVDCSAGDT